MAAISADKKNLVERLYNTEKKSMREVAEYLGVSLNAVTYFMRHHDIKRRLPSENGKILFDKKPLSFKRKKCTTKKAQELRVTGAMLYWAEGYKTKRSSGIDFANSDPDMIKIFINFLHSTYDLDMLRLRGHVYCYANQNVKEIHEFWSKRTGIPLSQFIKPYVRSDFRESGRKMKHGLVHVRYSDKKLLRDILNLIESYKHTLS